MLGAIAERVGLGERKPVFSLPKLLVLEKAFS